MFNDWIMFCDANFTGLLKLAAFVSPLLALMVLAGLFGHCMKGR